MTIKITRVQNEIFFFIKKISDVLEVTVIVFSAKQMDSMRTGSIQSIKKT
jgi:hypothetical protein